MALGKVDIGLMRPFIGWLEVWAFCIHDSTEFRPVVISLFQIKVRVQVDSHPGLAGPEWIIQHP